MTQTHQLKSWIPGALKDVDLNFVQKTIYDLMVPSM